MRSSLIVALLVVSSVSPSFALEAVRIRESDGPNAPAGAPAPCPLAPNLNGTCANYKWYNLCSGYLWLFSGWQAGEGVGVKFGGPSQPCVTSRGCVVGPRAKGIFYFRNVVPNYGQYVDLYLDQDCNNDGCPEGVSSSALNVDPGLLWNCVNFGTGISCRGVILRQVHHGGPTPTFVTDGPFANRCDPTHPPTHSYYYGINGSACVPWNGQPTTAPDDFVMWLVIDNNPGFDCDPVATQNTSWGAIKGLYR